MADWLQADEALFGLIRDREVVGRMAGNVAGLTDRHRQCGREVQDLGTAHRRPPGCCRWSRQRRALGAALVAVPPSAYTARGGVGTLTSHAKVIAARDMSTAPDPDDPAEAFRRAA